MTVMLEQLEGIQEMLPALGVALAALVGSVIAVWKLLSGKKDE